MNFSPYRRLVEWAIKRRNSYEEQGKKPRQTLSRGREVAYARRRLRTAIIRLAEGVERVKMLRILDEDMARVDGEGGQHLPHELVLEDAGWKELLQDGPVKQFVGFCEALGLALHFREESVDSSQERADGQSCAAAMAQLQTFLFIALPKKAK
jgi:hypothetical protein